ncbi:MAG: hypothetical protein ACLGIR_12250 [Actinomycetes bacterium]
MAGEDAAGAPAGPAVEGPLPLVALRYTLGPRTVVADLAGVSVVRTATRPDTVEGNALHLHAAPRPGDVARLLGLWDDRFGGLPGIEHVRVRWVEPADRDPAELAALVEEATRAGLAVDTATHLELDAPVGVEPAVGVELVAPDDPRRWHGAAVLYRHGGWDGDDTGARDRDELWAWRVDGWRVLAEQGRGLTRLALRHGTPVGVASLAWDPKLDLAAHDRGHAGLAAVSDVLVHPAHHGTGVEATLVAGVVGDLLDGHPRALVTARTSSVVLPPAGEGPGPGPVPGAVLDDGGVPTPPAHAAAGAVTHRLLGFRPTATLGGLRRR